MRSAVVARWAAVAAAMALLALGVPSSVQQVPLEKRRPAWEHALAPLAHAPIPSGRAVALVAPAPLDVDAARPLLYEACWQRPDLRFALAMALEGTAPEIVVTLPGAVAPPGLRAIWGRDGLTVWRRAPR